jgi:hypothetical protein
MYEVVSLFVALSLSQTAPAATGRLSGQVVVAGTNAPVAGARVMVFPIGRPSMPPSGPITLPPQSTTDQNGRFVFNGLAAGQYRLDVQKTGFASLLDPTTRPQMYTVGAGQALDTITIVLQRGAVISGKVLDQNGEPVTDARVVALRRINLPNGAAIPRLIPTAMQGPQQTNDLGEYRVTGLAAGEYYVAAVPRSMTFGDPSGAASGSGEGAQTATTTFYPGTADQAGALPIGLAAGAEVSNIVFTLQTAPAFRVSGIVVDETGAPVARAMVMLMNDPRNGMAILGPGANTQTGNDGRFSIGDVTAGTYRVNASVPMIMSSGSGGVAASGGGTGGGSNFTSWSVSSGGVTTTVSGGTAPLEVVVADADVRGVRVVVHRPPPPQ